MNAAAYWLLAEHLFRRACKTLLRSGTDFEFNTFDNANHFFQAAITGQKNEYAQLDKNFVPGFAQSISSWILQQ